MSRRLPVLNYPNLYVNNNYYYWKQKIDGKSYEKCTKVFAFYEVIVKDGHEYAVPLKNVKIAFEKADRMRNEVIREGHLPRKVKFAEIFDKALEIQQTKAYKTYLVARTADKHLRPFFENRFIQDFEREDKLIWSKYVTAEKEKGERKLTHDRRHLVFCLRNAQQSQLIKREYSTRDLLIPDIREAVGKHIEDHYLKMILDEIKTIGDKKFYVQVMLALKTGMRKGEILGLMLKEINIVNKKIKLCATRIKTRRERSCNIPIPENVFELLRPFIEETQKQKGKYIFPGRVGGGTDHELDYIDQNYIYDWNRHQEDIPNYWRQIKEKLKLDIRFHDFRHTCITNMIDEGIPLATISKYLGASMKILNEIYYQRSDRSEEKIRNVFNGRFETA